MTGTPDTSNRNGLPERLERNREVARLRDGERLTWPAIAARVGCSERTARRAYADHLHSAIPTSLRDVDPAALVARVIDTHERALDQLERMLSDADNDNARVGAARSCASVGGSLLAVLAQVGYLPDDAARWELIGEVRDFCRQIIEACDAHGIPAEVMESLWADLDEITGSTTSEEMAA